MDSFEGAMNQGRGSETRLLPGRAGALPGPCGGGRLPDCRRSHSRTRLFQCGDGWLDTSGPSFSMGNSQRAAGVYLRLVDC